MAKKTEGTVVTSKLFPLTEEDLKLDMPDKDDFEKILDPNKNPLEVRVSSETKESGDNTQSINNTQDSSTNPPTPVVNTEAPKIDDKKTTVQPSPKQKVVDDDDISFTLPNNNGKKQTGNTKEPTLGTQTGGGGGGNNTPPPPAPDPYTDPNLSPPNYGDGVLDDDIWKISDLKGGKDGPQGGGSPFDGDGVEMPQEVMDESVKDLADTAIIVYESMILAGMKDRVKIDIPNFIGEMFALNIRQDYIHDYVKYVSEYNQSIDDDFKMSAQVKASLRHAVQLLLGKYSGFTENIGPELQAMLVIGNILHKDYKKSNRWLTPSKQLLSQMDDRLNATPKNAPIQTQKVNTTPENIKENSQKKKTTSPPKK